MAEDLAEVVPAEAAASVQDQVIITIPVPCTTRALAWAVIGVEMVAVDVDAVIF